MKNTLSFRCAAVICIVFSLPLITGCIEAAFVGATTTGVLVGNDRRPAEVVLGDERVELTAINRLGQRLTEKSHLNITSYNYTVRARDKAGNASAQSGALSAKTSSAKTSRAKARHIWCF